jgi:hypothetical protein
LDATGGGGGGGGFSTITCVDAWLVKPRASVQVAPTVIDPEGAPVVLNVAELPLPEIFPPLAVQLPTDTETPSGLVQLQVTVALPPAVTVDGLAEQLIVGGFFGGIGFTV